MEIIKWNVNEKRVEIKSIKRIPFAADACNAPLLNHQPVRFKSRSAAFDALPNKSISH